MKVIQVFNRRQSWGGEDLSIEDTTELLCRNGIDARLWIKDVANLRGGLYGRMRAFASGIYSLTSAREMSQLIARERPDVVHAHNIYPQLSPSIFVSCRREGTPVIFHPHDQRPVCPTGFHLRHGQICERCCGGREFWCVLRNCRNNLPESIAYALRTYVARRFRLFHNNVTLFMVWSEFLKYRLVAAGFEKDRIVVVPHPVKTPDRQFDPVNGDCIGYVGRISPEKGLNVLLAAAGQLTDIRFEIAGAPSNMPGIASHAPGNVTFVGWLERDEIAEFYRQCRFVVIPSICFEVFPTVALEAMGFGVPVIGAKTGGIPEVVQNDVTGLTFEPGNSAELAEKIRYLWDRPDLCRQLGERARRFVIENYDDQVYFDRLMEAYELAIRIVQDKRASKGRSATKPTGRYDEETENLHRPHPERLSRWNS